MTVFFSGHRARRLYRRLRAWADVMIGLGGPMTGGPNAALRAQLQKHAERTVLGHQRSDRR